MKVWIASGGINKQTLMVAPLTLPQPAAPSNGESKVGTSDPELPSPRQVIPKVQQVDNVEHTLNKGLWVGTGAMRQGWKIFVDMSIPLFFFWVSQLLILSVQDHLMVCIPTCPAVSDPPTQVLRSS